MSTRIWMCGVMLSVVGWRPGLTFSLCCRYLCGCCCGCWNKQWLFTKPFLLDFLPLEVRWQASPPLSSLLAELSVILVAPSAAGNFKLSNLCNVSAGSGGGVMYVWESQEIHRPDAHSALCDRNRPTGSPRPAAFWLADGGTMLQRSSIWISFVTIRTINLCPTPGKFLELQLQSLQ